MLQIILLHTTSAVHVHTVQIVAGAALFASAWVAVAVTMWEDR